MTPSPSCGVDQRRLRADRRAAADARRAQQRAERQQRRVGADLDAGVDDGRAGVDDRDAGRHVSGEDPPLRLGADLREVAAVVDAEREAGVVDDVGAHRSASGTQDRQHVGQVQLALGVVGADLAERVEQLAAVERVDAAVDLADLQLGRGRVAGLLRLDDALDGAVGRAHDAAVAGRVRQHHRQHRRRGGLLDVGRRERVQRGARHQRHVAVEDDHRRVAVDLAGRGLDRVGRAARLLLDGEHDVVGEPRRERAIGAADDDDLGRARGAGRVDGPAEQRSATERVQQFRRCGTHARSLARREDDDDRSGHVRHRSHVGRRSAASAPHVAAE